MILSPRQTSFLITLLFFLTHDPFFNFTDNTKMTYKVDATEETLPTALGNGTYKGEECNVGFTSAFPKDLDSGQKATEQLNVAN